MDTSSFDPPQHAYTRLACVHCGHFHDVPVYCKNRFCPVCTGSRRARAFRRLSRIVRGLSVSDGARLRFLTLTIPSVPEPKQGLDTLWRCFRRLRQTSWWKKLVSAGIAVAEVTFGDSGWHVHLHVIVLSTWIPQRELSHHWKAVSPGRIVDIRLIPARDAISYLCKYMTKPSVDYAKVRIVSDALASRRMYTAFGAAYKLDVPDEERQLFECSKCGHTQWIPLDSVIRGVLFRSSA